MLSAASSGKYGGEDILEKIGFVATDSTAHNSNVIEDLCKELGSDTIQNLLLCNVLHLMMQMRRFSNKSIISKM